MAKEDMPINKFQSLMEFQAMQGVDFSGLKVGKKITYFSRSSGEDFQSCVSEAIRKPILDDIKAAKMFTVLIDESTDLAVEKHMVVYIRVLDEHFRPHTVFLKNVTVDDPKSDALTLFTYLVKALEEDGLDISKCVGFGSDGAAVMTGKLTGVAARMREKSPHLINIHCMAHRFNLATAQASDGIDVLKNFEQVLSDLYRYFGGSKSGNRKAELVEIQKVLGDPVMKIKECHEIRWIAFYQAVKAVYSSWSSLVTFFQKQIDEKKKVKQTDKSDQTESKQVDEKKKVRQTDKSDQTDSKSKNFLEKIQDYRFVLLLSFLMDILPAVAEVSMHLQKTDVDVSSVFPSLKALKKTITKAEEGKSPCFEKLVTEEITKEKKKNGDYTYKYKKHTLLCHGKEGEKGSEQGTSMVERMKAASDEIREVRKNFCENMKTNIEKRFPEDSKNVAVAFKVLSLKTLYPTLSEEERDKFGKDEIRTLIDHYGKDKESKKIGKSKDSQKDRDTEIKKQSDKTKVSDKHKSCEKNKEKMGKKEDSDGKKGESSANISKAFIDEASTLAEWASLKEIVTENKYPRYSMKDLWKLLYEYHKTSFPNLFALANLALVMPYQTASCERGFSAQNSIKTARRNRLGEKSMNILMTIKCEGEKTAEHDLMGALELWEEKERKCNQ